MINDYPMYDYPMSLYSPDDIKDIIFDWSFENDDAANLIIDGDPYYDGCCWQQAAHDDKCDYTLAADAEGNIRIYTI